MLLLTLWIGLVVIRLRPSQTTSGEPGDAKNAARVSVRPATLTGGATAPRREGQRRSPLAPWALLASDDPREFAANLRRADCPEETFCDLVYPAIQRAYAARIAGADHHPNFWLSGQERWAHRRQVQERVEALEAERDALAAELACGRPWLKEFEEAEGDRIVGLIAGFLPGEKQRALMALVGEVDRFTRHWRSRTEGVCLPSDVWLVTAEAERIRARILAEIGSSEFEEICLRVAAVFERGDAGSVPAAAIALTPGEFRELIRRSFVAGENDALHLLGLSELLESASGRERPPKRSEEEVRADAREVLGVAREEESHFRENPSFSTTANWVQAHSLPAETPRVVFAELEQFRQQVAALKEQWRDDPEGVRFGFAEARRQTLARLQSALARVPEKERGDSLRNWIQLAAFRGWDPP